MSIEEFDKVLNFYDKIIFCGQVSDPILHPKFIDFLKMVNKRDKQCDIHTAVSHKPEKFFREAFAANSSAKWIFGIDGLPKDSHKYRARQDGEKLFQMAIIAREYGCKVDWQYIIFNYNENNIDEAKQLAKKYDINLKLVMSNRFHYKQHLNLKPTDKQNYVR